MRRCCLIPLLALVAGCSDDPSTVTLPTPSPTVTATTAAPPVTATATNGPARDGDVDGDGTQDAVRPSMTTLSVTLSGSGTVVTAPVHTETPGTPRLLGSADVDRDGHAELFLETAQGASTTFVTPYRFDGKALHEVQLDGSAARLGIGGSVTHGDGFACLADGTLQVRSAESSDGDAFTVRTDTFRLAGSALTRLTGRTTTGRQGDEAVDGAFTVSCGSVEAEG